MKQINAKQCSVRLRRLTNTQLTKPCRVLLARQKFDIVMKVQDLQSVHTVTENDQLYNIQDTVPFDTISVSPDLMIRKKISVSLSSSGSPKPKPWTILQWSGSSPPLKDSSPSAKNVGNCQHWAFVQEKLKENASKFRGKKRLDFSGDKRELIGKMGEDDQSEAETFYTCKEFQSSESSFYTCLGD